MSAEPVPPDEPVCPQCQRLLERPPIVLPLSVGRFYFDAPPGTVDALMEWRKGSTRVGRRELLVRLVEVDGMWEETVLQEAQAPPQPLPRRVIRRRG